MITYQEKNMVRRINFRGREGKEKVLELVAYQFELVYDLSLSSTDNMSENPGFESCLGVW
jgi:hypothetical protein